ncbi:hypothetical protein BDY24DRAFT_138432 [Mrakia frigida]|uniref:uncharacterized protein n=1 Tax=Mrakia frigida TaxID=29902 RepID=UPI003FCC1CDF
MSPSAANSGLFPPSTTDPSPEHTFLVEQGTQAVEEGNYKEAKRCYEEALKIERNGTVLFNKGVVEYCLKDHESAISSWLESIAFEPENADAHTNLASAYILSTPPKGDFAEKHLRAALSLNPLDPEISFNLAAVLEARGQLQEALSMYERARGLGVERAEQNVRSLGAKIVAAQAAEDPSSSSSGSGTGSA